MRALIYFLIILAVFFLVLFVYSRLQQLKHNIRDTLDPKNETPETPPTSSKEEKMVTCHYCGVHLPKSEALKSEALSEPGTEPAERFYCCTAHRDADKNTTDA